MGAKFDPLLGALRTTDASSSGGSGTVTSTSVVSANGLAGTVATPTSTPAITLSTTVTGLVKGNGTSFLAATSGTDYAPGTAGNTTGIVKSTTGTGALTTAIAGDFPTLNQNTTGSAASFTGSLSGDVTGTQSATVVGKINGVSMAGLATGILKNTTTTGVPSIAVAADFPTLNQNTTGNAATVTTNANLTGPITSTGNTTSIASQTGTGTKFVVDTSPTLVTPNIGVATATSVNKVAITAPATSSTLTIANGKTLTANNSLTLAGTDATTMTFPSTSATIARTDAANTFTGHQTIEGVTSTGATGTGNLVFGSSPTMTTPVIDQFSSTSGLGAAWTSWTPTWGAISGGTNTLGNGTIAAAYVQVGKTVFFRITLTWGSTTSSTGVDWSFSPPVTPSSGSVGPPIGHTISTHTGVNDFIGDCRLFSTTQIQPRCANASGTFLTNGAISTTSPYTWVSTDVLKISGFYEAA